MGLVRCPAEKGGATNAKARGNARALASIDRRCHGVTVAGLAQTLLAANGCWALSLPETISAADGLPAMAFSMASLVAS